ncbi:hypothetical protein AgCh_020133 [Apium graveolens]
MFFSSCGEIEYVEMQSSKSEQSQIAFVTFKHSIGADCAIMLSGAKLLDLTVIITLAPSREIPSTASSPYPATGEKATDEAESHLLTTKDVFSSILEKGYVLGKAFAVGTSDKVQQVEQNLQVSKKVKSAVAKSAVLSNQYLSIGASWVTVAFDSVAKAAAEVSQYAKEKAAIAEEEERRKITAEEEQTVAKAAAEVSQHAKEKGAIAEEEQIGKMTAEEEQRVAKAAAEVS